MKKIFSYCLILSVLSTTMLSCSKNDTGGGASTPDSVYVSLSKETIITDGFDYVKITVKDKNGADITSGCKLYANSALLTSSRFTAIYNSNYTISARNGTIPSNVKVILPVIPAASPFTKKMIVEDVTGAWCGYCPRIANSLENYKATQPNCFVVAIHGGGGTDAFKYEYYNNFNSAFGISGYPTAIVNRQSTPWSENTSDLNGELSKWAPLGLAIESSNSGTSITGTVKVKFNVSTDQSMKIVVALVENGLIANQTNYYSPTGGATPYLYGGANPIVGFTHNGVLRKTATDLFGDLIPAAQQVKDGTWSLPFTIPLSGNTGSGSTYSAVAANCSIIAYVLDGSSNKRGVFNVQYAPVGTVKNFD